MVIKLFNKVRNSNYLSNIFTIILGSGFSQLLPIITSPILARIYDPKDYGNLGIYMGFSLVLGSLSTLQYSNALLLPKDESEFQGLVKLCLLLIGVTTISLLLLLIIFINPILNFLNAKDLKYIIFLLPLSVGMIGIQNILAGCAGRRKQFKSLSKNRIIASISTVLCSISIGLIYKTWIGLLAGYIVGQLFNSFLYYFTIRKSLGLNLKSITNPDLRIIAKKYSSFPKYSMSADILNNFTHQIPIFLLNKFSGASTVGNYNMCNRLLAMPSGVIASSVGEVFRQKSSEEFHSKGNCRDIYLKTLKSLVLFAIVPFSVILFWGPELFKFFFGPKWETAGHYARIVGPIFILRFVNSPLSFLVYLYNKLKLDLIATIYLNVSSIIILFFSLQNLSVENSLILFALNFSALYLFMIFYTYNLSKTNI